MKVHGITFGNPDRDSTHTDGRSAARFALSGGTLELGASGLKKGPKWSETAVVGSDRSWYECVFSGGTFKPSHKDCNLAANVRLSDKDGGTTFEISGNAPSFTGSFHGSGGFRKTGSGTLQLAGANDYTGRTEVVAGKLGVGMRYETAVWQADSLAATLASGATISEWANASGTGSTVWSFKHATTIPGTEGTTPPTYVTNGFGAHAALTFNGAQSAFLTGIADQPISEKSEFLVSLVFKTEPGFKGCAGTDFYRATQIFGTSIGGQADRLYGLSIDDQGRLGCGMFSSLARQDPVGKTNCTLAVENLWATNNVVNDGKPHVVIWSWKFNNGHVLQVDDQVYRCGSPSNLWWQTAKTRIVLGVGEQQSATKRFKGAIADLRMKNAIIGDASRTDLARQLGVRYGVEAFAGQMEYPYGAAAASTETVPSATATWRADTLAQTAGQEVSAWAEADGKGSGNGSAWTFNTTVGGSIMTSRGKTAVAPVIASDTVNGHKLVSFNGTNACLALTGSYQTPAGDGDGLTVAAVVRFTGYGIGVTNQTHRLSGHFLSSEFALDSGTVCWGLGLNAAGRLTSGMVAKVDTTEYPFSIKSRRRFLNDGNLHVVVLSVPKKGQDRSLLLSVDGVTNTVPCAQLGNSIKNTRILLGGSEVGNVGRFVPVDVAEFAFWKGTTLTPGQIETLTRALCAKYGVWAEGYERFAVGEQQRSHEIVVHAGAQYGGVGSHDFALYPGQTIWGDGATTGHAIVLPGAYVRATCTNTFTMANVEFVGGGLEASFTADGTLQPIAVAGAVNLPMGDVPVKVTAPNGIVPGGVLLTWTGRLSIGSATRFVVEGPFANMLKVKVDEVNKCLRLVSCGGSMLIIR